MKETAKKQNEKRRQKIEKVRALVADGFTNKEIAEKIGCSLGSVNGYVQALLCEYKCSNRIQLAVKVTTGG